MSARAIASAKQKRVGSVSSTSINTSVNNNSTINPTLSDPTKTNKPVTIPQAIVLLDQRILELESSLKGSTIPNQTELMAGFAQHLNTLDAVNEESKTQFKSLEKDNAVLQHKNNELYGKLNILEQLVKDLQGKISSESPSIASIDVSTQLSDELKKGSDSHVLHVESIEKPKLVRSTNIHDNEAGLGNNLQ